ncbi:23S rRNA (pseudouridine(1915)-N(3))-methyltransferase RlmH [Alicyclobacillus tolerans]|uniref:Ribosomal RNA large subunit methyltransferase H n=2 Tax=Alicyclobacillus tolerans TaxID=90970 RepID=A0ABT9LUC3_9BACL|nr:MULTISPECIES: 23S rRNA (pseudouridine(1915)-N(3))-methyltransferase RlmH [Alicyclobacillus]MDP9727871.1 23S rRNA (pseudouridine1915-N3)-methyltransferase [Alicyclobacillus tengchongensis]QRF24516.1 23S rRNA (pseudouridine(1915)-N(3))-methyltransferase RlmH [Alicyclobacillus sp. TC]SHK50653.1 23S rRNA (pseudouridine1915-N3)-methyltransferase [Alicyclobacillus montanus]
MQICILSVGKIKEKFYQEALAEYAKRLNAYVQLEILEVDDEPCPEHYSAADKERVLQLEAKRLSRHLRQRDGLVLLDILGKELTSEKWSQQYQELCGRGFGRLVFIVGGSLGVHSEIRARSDFRWSFGPLTLPHALARVVLLEQLYRGIRIQRGEPYHK